MKHLHRILLAALALSLSNYATASQKDDEGMAGYLMTYFSDSDHSLHFAVSDDGYTFTAINDNKPVISGDTIATRHT